MRVRIGTEGRWRGGREGGRDGAPFVADDFAEHPRAFLEDGREVEAVRALEFEAELPDVVRFEGGHDQGVVAGYVGAPPHRERRCIGGRSRGYGHTRNVPERVCVSVAVRS